MLIINFPIFHNNYNDNNTNIYDLDNNNNDVTVNRIKSYRE